MLLHLSTWPEIETYLETSQGIIIPVGSTEQHGPTGLIGTDAICAETLAQGVGKEVNAIVGPTISVGMALHHLDFPGSISLQPSTLILYIKDYLSSLARHGFNRFFFINGHGGNVATLKAAFAETYGALSDRGIEVRCQLQNWYMVREVYQLAQQLYGNQEGSHATPSEVALTQYAYPDQIKSAPLEENVARGFPIYSAKDFRQSYPDGRMGSNPDLATPDHGKQFYDMAVPALSKKYLNFIAS